MPAPNRRLGGNYCGQVSGNIAKLQHFLKSLQDAQSSSSLSALFNYQA